MVRTAKYSDVEAILRLARTLCLPRLLHSAEVIACLDRGHLLVIDLGVSIGGVAYVSIHATGDDELHARLELLAVHPALTGTGTEDDLVSGILAISEASGCVDVDVGPSRPRPHAA